MKKLQKKILILVISSILISSLVVIVIAFSNYNRIIERNSEKIIQLMCSEKRQTIDEKLLNIEQSVNTIYQFVIGQISEVNNLWQDEGTFIEHISRMRALMKTTAKYTDGAVSVYYYLNPDINGEKQGVWIVQDESGNFIDNEMTDISKYSKEDVEHVGWYYIPITNAKETWINPYYNRNMDEEIISYVIPIIIDGKVIGVIGMDISTTLLYENAKTLTVFNTGYAFLMDNEGEFVYHPEMKDSSITTIFDKQHKYLYDKSLLSVNNNSVEAYKWNNINKNLTSQRLRNGMIFTVCVPEDEIKEPQHKMLIHSIYVIVIVMIAFIIVTVSIIKAIVKLMYTDSMTRVGNKAAYAECIEILHKRIHNNEKLSFTVIVIDINDLKKVNDNYGHEYGDILIKTGADLLKKVWKNNFIYRIGGDEFTIIYSDVEKELVEKDILLLEEEINNYNLKNDGEKLGLQMAIGMAIYDPENDLEYMDVFRKADIAMYENKKQKKDSVGIKRK